ncbi:MAG: hypothetical protein Q7U75_05765 [Desulfobacterales bacterium]|nr:hypothetical protein [Desulfobacterales bacterium]
MASSGSGHNIGGDGFSDWGGGSTLCARDTADMRKLFFVGIVTMGALVGGLTAVDGESGLRAVMALFGAIVGAAIGGAILKVGLHPLKKREIPGIGTTSEDLSANYWRDRGNPPR